MANNIRGITIEIGGDTSKLGKALEDVNKKSRDLSSELGQVNKLLKLDPGNTELLAQKQKILAEAVENTSKKLDILKTAEKQVQEQFERGEVSEEQVRALQREIIATESKLKSYEGAARETADEIDRLGDDSESATKDVDRLGDEAKKTGEELESAGDKASTFGEKVKNAGAIAVKGLTAIGSAAGAATTALAGASVNAASYADDVLTMSTVTGVSTEKLQEYKYASELVDVSVETLTKSMAKNIKSMKGAQDGSKAYVETYQKLGVAVTDANGNLRDSETVYWECVDALGKLENETERDALAMQIFGKSAQELNPLIEAGSDRMKELGQEAHEVGAVMSGETLDALGAFDDSIQRLKGGAGAAKNALGTVLLPELQLLTDTGGGLLNEFTQKLNASGGGLEGLMSTIDDMSGEIGRTVADLFAQLLTKIATLLPTVANVAISLIGSLATTIVSALPQIVSSLIELISMVAQSIGQIIEPLIEILPSVIMAICTVLLDNLPILLKGIISLIMTLCQNIAPLVQALLPLIPLLIMEVCDALIECLPLLIEACISLIVLLFAEVLPQVLLEIANLATAMLGWIDTHIIQPIAKFFSGLFEDIKTGVSNAISSVKSVFSTVASWVNTTVIQPITGFFSKLWNGFKSGAVNAWEGVKSVFSKVGSFFGSIFNTVKEKILSVFSAGGKIFSGIKDGIVNVFKTVVNAIIKGINKVISIPLNGLNTVLNKISGIEILGVSPFSWLTWRAPIPQIPLLARGGIVNRPTLAGIGEDGAEAIVPLENNTEWLDKIAQRLDRNTPPVNDGRLLAQLDRIYERLNRLQVVLNNGVLVGEILDDIDAGLADRQLLSERGI